MYPAQFKYTKHHMWLHAEGDQTATIGLTAQGAYLLGEVLHVEMPKVGNKFAAGDDFGIAESQKMAFDLHMPVTGKVVEINGDVNGDPGQVSEDAHNTWIIKIEMSGAEKLDGLLTADQYEAFIAELD